MCDGYAEFPWIEGVSLQDILLEHLKHGRDAEAKTLIDQYIGKVNAICNAEIYNADLIFSNIIVNKCIWTVIDYEWTFDEKVPPEWIIYRAIHYLCAESGDLREEELLRLAGQAHANAAQQPNGEDAISHFKDYERRFQDYIRGSAESLADIALRESGNIIPFEGNRSIEERIAEQLINAKEMSVRKLIYNIDDRRNADGRISVRGWACGKVSGHEYIPASLSVFESDGMPAPAAIARIEREDVADVVGDKSGFPCYGFDIRMRIEKGRSYVLRIKTGKRYVDLNLND
jgi:hypothetical protein